MVHSGDLVVHCFLLFCNVAFGTMAGGVRLARSVFVPRQVRGSCPLCRGMRLADMLFLTLAVACLQIYVGMRCSSPIPDSCMFRPVRICYYHDKYDYYI